MKLYTLLILSSVFCIIDGELFTLATLGYVAIGGGVGYFLNNFYSNEAEPRKWFPPIQQEPIRYVCHPLLNSENLRGSLQSTMVGQHIAVEYVHKAVKGHYARSPEHALSLVLSGSTGTGKNLVSTLVGKSYWGDDQRHVHVFAGRQKYTNASKVPEYQKELSNFVTDKVKECAYSIFIFDEIDKIPPGILDVLKPFMDYHTTVNGVNYRNAVFLFLTNYGGFEINSKYEALLRSGVNRKDMSINSFNNLLTEVLFAEGMFKNAEIISSHLINGYVPFLPLEYDHVKQCIVNEFARWGIKPSKSDVEDIIESMTFRGNQYSLSGCKRVSHLVAVKASSRA